MKKLLSIMLSLAMVVGVLAGCGGDSGESPAPSGSTPAQTTPAETTPAETTPAEGETRSVGFVMLGLGNEFFDAIVTAYTEVFENAGWEADYVSGDYDNTKIVEGIENYAAMGKDVIIIFPMSGDAVASAVHNAREAGSKVIMMVEECEEWDGYLSSDNLTTGKANAWMCAQWIEEKYPDAEPGSIPVALVQVFDSVTNTQQSEGLESITEYTDKVYVATRYELDGQDTSDGLEAAENLYTTNPEIKLFLTTSNAVALGINSFYTGISSPVDDLSEYGAWGTNSTQEALEAVAASADNTSMVRGINIQAGVGETARCFLYLAEGLTDGSIEKEEIPATVYLVTADNVEQYMAEETVSLQWDYENAVAVEVTE